MQSFNTTTRWCILLLTILDSANGFTLFTPTTTTTTNQLQHSRSASRNYRNNASFLNMASDDQGESKTEDDANSGMSFEDATAALKDQEDAEKAAARGEMLKEDTKKFAAKKGEFDEMRSRIRSRASDLNMKKSEATAEAIKAATQRAAAGEEASTPTVDLSKFSSALSTEEDPEDALTDEQKKEIDKVGQMNIIDQVKEEIKNTKFPTPSATLKQAVLMVIIFIVTAGVILKADELLRFQITDWGFIPKTGEVIDYSDLSLPEGFTDAMTDSDLASM
jgi:preprotein translocase subunit SecE